VILVVDAHALLWALGAPDQLADDARAALTSPANDVLVSAASIWEVAIKQALGKLRAPAGLVAASESLGFSVLPITGADAERASALPMHHRDPFDRMLVAQASRLDATIVSRDEAFAAYGVNVIRA
jgi:PIN domain nuclease of toxin-antitoxin system